MRVFCGSCQTFVDVEDATEVHPEEPYVCSKCQAKVRRGRSMQLDFDDGQGASGATEESGEPISMSDLETYVDVSQASLSVSGERPVAPPPSSLSEADTIAFAGEPADPVSI